MLFKNYISRKVTKFKLRTVKMMENMFENLFHGGMFSLLMTTLVWISIFLYVVFYYAYVPASSYVRPVHLQVEPCRKSDSNYCPFPSAYVRLTKRKQILMKGQPYRYYVQLDMPESPVNKELGMFMVCLQLRDKKGYLASHSCRSNMLRYNSDLITILKLLVFSPFFVLGSREEKQTLIFELYTDFEEDQNHPVTDVYVEVRARNIEIYSASLHINAHLIGLRYLMYYWPVTSAILGISFNLCIIFFTTALSLYHSYLVDTGSILHKYYTENNLSEGSSNREQSDIESSSS